MRRALPPVWFAAAVVVMVALHVLAPGRRIVPGRWHLLGLVPVAAGLALNLVADRAFEAHATTVKPFEESTALVTDGPFARSRNPMYVGLVAMLAGLALLLGTASPWVPVLGMAALLDRGFIRAEERMLERTFGETYRAYRTRVRRWL